MINMIGELFDFLFRKDLTEQFHQLKLRLLQLTAAGCRDRVVASHFSRANLVITCQHFGLLQGVQERIKRSRAYTVTVLCQFVDQPKAVNGLLRCMV